MPTLRILIVLLFGLCIGGNALAAEDVLPVEQAFQLSAAAQDAHTLRLSWDIADGYYLYRKKITVRGLTPGVDLGAALFPPAQTKHDEYFGDVEIYRGHLDVIVPFAAQGQPLAALAVQVGFQGCADRGICYPPHKQTVEVALPKAGGAALGGLGDALKHLGLSVGQADLLPAEQAFQLFAEVKDADTLALSWRIAEGYYLYREKFKFELMDSPGVRLGNFDPPHGQPMEDEAFGHVEVFHEQVAFNLPLLRDQTGAVALQLKAGFQGCAERGVCYPPMQQTVTLELPASSATPSRPAAPVSTITPSLMPPLPSGEGRGEGFATTQPASEQDRIAQTLKGGSWWLIILTFLGFGLLVAFTPCCFPMIPILSGIIVGHGHHLTTYRAFILSLVYVLSSALTYTLFGVLAGLFGANLQTLFQQPWVLVLFALLFVALALSMFGFYELQMPNALQTRLDHLSRRQKSGSITGVAVMGFLSTLIVGPCVAAPLAGALIYIGQTGDALLGGVALFSMGFGAGLPLLAIGTSAGKLLPRAGHWMHATKAVFGVGLLAVAVWLLERVLPSALSMTAWALLLIIPAVFMGALDHLAPDVSGWRRLWKGVGLAMLTYGILLLIGVAADSRDPLQPLRVLGAGSAQAQSIEQAAPLFQTVRSSAELEQKLAAAHGQGRAVLLDFYADWCISCKEMERYTFADPRVRQALSNVVLLKADISANSDDDAALLKRFQLIGPPATLFFGPDGQEKPAFRVIGFMDAEHFLHHLQQAL
ncbi:MAG: protein-disulfide reductase DsbD [Methylococcaceae bacterium]|nr:MAG: protein-disulfide reductase DsbD [Methylococcaceae bacterium]